MCDLKSIPDRYFRQLFLKHFMEKKFFGLWTLPLHHEELQVSVHTIPPNVYRANVVHLPYRMRRTTQVWRNATFTLHLARCKYDYS